MIRVPWLPHTFGAMTQGLLELIDVFPTLQELAGFPVSPELEGVSHAGLIQALGGGASSGSQQQSGELLPPRTVALAQFPRCIAAGSENASWYWDRNNCNSNTSGELNTYWYRTHLPPKLPTSPPRLLLPPPVADQYTAMGMTMRTVEGWRFTRWVRWNGVALRPDWSAPDFGEELYDHRSEPALGSFDSQSDNLAQDPTHAQTVARLRKQLQQAFEPPAAAWATVTASPVALKPDDPSQAAPRLVPLVGSTRRGQLYL